MGGMDAKHDTISIHTPLAGSDPDSHTVTEAGSIFQSTLPLRGATEVPAVCGVGDFISIHTPLAGSDADCPDHAMAILFQSTLPLRGATNNLWYCQRLPYISIHTPLAGSDRKLYCYPYCVIISIHTPLAGSDPNLRPCGYLIRHFNPHSPCGERHDCEY